MKRILSFFLIMMILCPVLPAFAADPVLVEAISINESAVTVPVNK